MFNEDPRIMYENPPPPDDYEFNWDADPVFFTFYKPQRIIGASFLKIDRSLVHKDLINGDEKEEEQNPTDTIQGDESESDRGNIENIKPVTTAELNAEVSVSRNILEKEIIKNKASKGQVVDNNGFIKRRIKCEPLEEDESAAVGVEKKKDQSKEEKRTHTDSDKSISKKKSIQYTKTPALESISKSYSRKSNSDSDGERQRKSKSSSSREKSHSRKSSGHRRTDKNSKKNTSTSDVVPYDKKGARNTESSVKQEVISSDDDSLSNKAERRSVKEEVLCDKDDDGRGKTKSSKRSKKKYRSDSKNRSDDDRSRDRYCDDSKNRSDDDHSRDRYRDDSRKKRHDGSSSDDSRKYSDDDSRSKYSEDSRDSKSYVKREIKQEPGSAAFYAPNDFYCDVCKLILNSETTFSSHMAGKRHKKALRLRSEQDVAISQILDMEGRTKPSVSRRTTPQERACPPKLKESQSCPRQPDMERIRLYDEVSKIQEACNASKLLIIGLDYVQEVRGYEETKYYCELCSAQCVANSIIKHITGFKHQLSCIKVYYPRTYDWIKDLDKRDKRVDREIKFNLQEAMMKYGRGRINVYIDKKRTQSLSEPYDPYQPSTSRQNPDAPIRKADELAGTTVTDEDCLSRDFSDFYCKVCDAHMNNHSMWESHARGKRHAKNKKKAPEGLVSDGNFIEAPRGTISHLEDLINEHCSSNDLIVGLNFIKENQGENGDLYNCFLCGSVCPTMDILDHLYLRKHKIKYLEKMLFNGYHNAINEISLMPIGDNAKESLIDDECDKMLQQVGPGKPVIAIAKKTF